MRDDTDTIVASSSDLIPITTDVMGLQVLFVNCYFISDSNDRWILVDAALPFSAGRIRRAAEARFGRGTRPDAVVLTHGHFDHVGALGELRKEWDDVPIFAHRLEMPYLTGRSSYPPADPTVGGGAMARMSPLYPAGPFDFRPDLHLLPEDGSVPGAPGWQWIHTPGHAPGHVSLFRPDDGVLLAGDAFVTTKQESMVAAMTNQKQMHGPPMYYTPDWDASRESVQRLADLHPSVAGTGHGPAMRGSELDAALQHLARHFDEIARPSKGRYVREPAVMDDSGVVSLPPPVADPFPKIAAGIGLAVLAGAAIATQMRRH